jgi:hypothetical protein
MSTHVAYRNSVSTNGSGSTSNSNILQKITKQNVVFSKDEIKIVHVRNKTKVKHPNEKSPMKNVERMGTEDMSDTKSILKSPKRGNLRIRASTRQQEDTKKVQFVDKLPNRDERKKPLAEVTIIPSYAMFYNSVYVDKDDSQDDKANCKCIGCSIF